MISSQFNPSYFEFERMGGGNFHVMKKSDLKSPEPSSEKQPVHNSIFHIQNLCKIYQTGEITIRALNGIDIDLYEGEMIVFLGPSGSGKSTFLNIIGGLDQASKGSVYFKDQELTDCDEAGLTKYRRDHVGFVFQFYNLIPSLTALENVALVTEISRNPMTPEEALSLVGLEDRMNHFPAQLSGGEQQRVAIARAIAKRPEVLLCDEPTGALDSKTGIVVLEALSKINRELGTTTAIITHNAIIQKMANRVIYFLDGKINKIRINDEVVSSVDIEW